MNSLQRRWRSLAALSRSCFSLVLAASVAGTLALAGCGGGSGMSSATAPAPASQKSGTALVSITDAPGDFVSYMVNVVSLKLTRSDGTVVETLPATTQVDFANLVNLSEIISARQVPEGSYTAASMTLDYSGATIVIDNGAGGITVPAANLINGTTNAPLVSPNSQLTLSLQLPAGQPLVITAGTVSNFALDFNLAASNTVAPTGITATTPASGVTVTVNPVLSASLAPDASKQIRVRGPLVSVGSGSYVINLRPFNDNQDDGDQVTVNVAATTTYTINGTAYTGAAGLTALAALPAGTLTAASGTFDVASKTFTATAVYAGTSVPGAGLDSVEGTVTARSGNVLTLSRGMFVGRDDDGGEYASSVAVTVATTTTVTEDGQSGTFGVQNISVGQHLQVFGTAGTDASGNRTLDASQGSARLMLTSLTGQVVSSGAGSVTLALQSLGGQPATAFDFTGTGSSSANDASAANYVVTVPTALALPALTQGEPVSFTGFVTPFGSAPPDFGAVTFVDYSNTAAKLLVEFTESGNPAPFAAPLSASNVAVTQATLQAADRASLIIGYQIQNAASLPNGVTFVADASATNPQFSIVHHESESIDTFTSFTDFVTALTTDLNGKTAAQELAAEGPFDSTKGVMSVDKFLVVLND